MSTTSSYKMNKTYETWDEESIDVGDTDDRGFEYNDRTFDSLWEMASEIRDGGPVESSDSGQPNPHTWYSTTDSEVNYKTGERTNYAWHPKGLSKKDAQELGGLLKLSQSDFNNAQPE